MTIVLIGIVIAVLGQMSGERNAVATLDRDRTTIGESLLLTVEVTGDGAADCEVSRPPRGKGLFFERAGSRTYTEVRTVEAADGTSERRPLLITRFFYRVYPLETGTLTIAPVEVELRSRRRALSAPRRLIVDHGQKPDWLDAAVTVKGDRFYRHQVLTYHVRITVPESAHDQVRLSLPWLDESTGLLRLDEEPPREGWSIPVHVIQSNREELFHLVSASESSLGCNDYARSFTFLLTETGKFSCGAGILALDDARARMPVRYCVLESPSLDVVDLPTEGRPASFTNGVGLFEITFDVEPRQVRVGDSFGVRFSITGAAGSLDAFDFPDFPVLAGSFRIFAKRDTAVALDQGRSTKSRYFELSPLSAAIDRVPPLEFSYFDPESEEYVIVEWEGAALEVFPGIGDRPPGEETRRKVDDIETIFDRYPFEWRRLRPFVEVLLLVSALGALCVWMIRIRGWFRPDPAVKRRQTASRQFREGMYALRGTATAEIAVPLFAEYLAERFGLARASAMAGEVEKPLIEKGISETLAREVERFFSELEEERYAAGSDQPLAVESINKALSLVESLEGEGER